VLDRFTDCLGIGCICFAALHTWFDICGRHQADIMTHLAGFSAPMMSRTACFHADNAAWECLKERQKFGTLDLLVENLTPSLRTAVTLKDGFV
jgi:hypothetical protein